MRITICTHDGNLIQVHELQPRSQIGVSAQPPSSPLALKGVHQGGSAQLVDFLSGLPAPSDAAEAP